MPKIDANDVAALYGAEVLRAETEALSKAADALQKRKFVTAWNLLQKHQMIKRPLVIDGVARERDIINIVASSKMGKTWLCQALMLSIASGTQFLRPEWKCTQGKVVILDNELHEDTIAHRLPTICEAMGLDQKVLDNVIVENFRGKLSSEKDDSGIDIKKLAPYMADYKELKPKFILLVSLYRFLPDGVSETDPGAITRIYNTLDRYADIVSTAVFGLVIHTTKGGQGDKDVMEVGSGTGAFGRATDNHIIIRDHEVEGQYVIDSRVRDQAPQPAVVIRKVFPLFEVASGEDPKRLKTTKPSVRRNPEITIEQVLSAASKFTKPARREVLVAAIARKVDQGRDPAREAFNRADDEGLFFSSKEHNPKGQPKMLYVLNVLAAEKWKTNQKSVNAGERECARVRAD